MPLTSAQLKGRIKSLASKNNADARNLLRIYAMERFLERLSASKYHDNFVIKGGILVTAMVGISQRSTMDIDTLIRNENLSAEDARKIISEIIDIDLGDEMTFSIKAVENIMDEMEYPGIRVLLDSQMEKMMIPLKIDISTGDVITPHAMEFTYCLMLENRSISLWSYNLETILAEKLQTILARGVLNTRMRDFYDVRTLLQLYGNRIDRETLIAAFATTCRKRETELLYSDADKILENVEGSIALRRLWESYRKKYSYSADITFEETVMSIKQLVHMLAGDDE